MRQVLFFIPLSALSGQLPDIPVYGYGMMLFLAFMLCVWLGGRLAQREGINPAFVADLALWLFVSGILGARLFFVLDEREKFAHGSLWRVIALWDGGLIFYGSIFGGLIGYAIFHRLVLYKMGVSHWKMADIVAPCVALGSCLGRVGCLLTGCCFGNVACADCPAIHFPIPNGPNLKLIDQGYETPLGFLMRTGAEDGVVSVVEAGSPADTAGLRSGDRLLRVNGIDVTTFAGRTREGTVERVPVSAQFGLVHALTYDWPRGEQLVRLQVRKPDGSEVDLPPFRAWGLGVHPTQIYESISMALLLFFLVSYYPFKVRDGSVMVFLMFGYGIHRFLNEMLRTDNEITATGLTLSQNISIFVLLAATVLALIVWSRKPTPTVAPPEPIAAT